MGTANLSWLVFNTLAFSLPAVLRGLTPCQLTLLAALSPGQGKLLVGIWAFAFGAAVGSFLNVVVYRLPAGVSLVFPGSHCPSCKHAIRWYDNVPVLGWVMLKGRCRDCGTRISPRYPLVEAVTAGLFVVIVAAQGLTLGANLPAQPISVDDRVGYPPLGFGATIGLVAFHLTLVCTLLCAVLIEYDGNRLPVKLLAPALIVGALAPLMLPGLHPVAAGPWLGGRAGGLVDGATGLAAGVVLGMILRPLVGAKWSAGLTMLLGTTGLFLGWQATVVLGLFAGAVHIPVHAAARLLPWLGRLPPTTWLGAGAVAWILSWKAIVQAWPSLG